MKTRHLAASCLTVALGFFGATTAVADTTEAPALSHEAVAADSATADISVTSSDVLAGESLTVLIINDGAEVSDPATDDVVFIEQYELDDAGTTDFAVQLPTDVLEDYDIAMNTAAGTDRYVAPLAGEADPDDGATDDPEEPGDGSSEEPGEDATTDPDEGQDDDGSEAGEDAGVSTGSDEGQSNGEETGGSEDASDAGGTDTSGGSNAAGSDADATDQNAVGDESSGGFLADTGASITMAVLLGVIAIGIGLLLVARRRKMAEDQPEH